MSTFSFLATAFFRSSTESVFRIFSEKGPPVKGATVSVIVDAGSVDTIGVTVTECGRLVACFSEGKTGMDDVEVPEVAVVAEDVDAVEVCFGGSGSNGVFLFSGVVVFL